jgi:hypothetical protein
LLVSWYAGSRCGMTCSNEDHGRSRGPGAEDRRWSHRSGTRWSGGREVGWRRVRSTPGTWRLGVRVSWLSLKPKSMVCEWFGIEDRRRWLTAGEKEVARRRCSRGRLSVGMEARAQRTTQKRHSFLSFLCSSGLMFISKTMFLGLKIDMHNLYTSAGPETQGGSFCFSAKSDP